MAIRRAVFVNEQGIPERDEFDAADAACVHFLAQACGSGSDGGMLGTARLLPGGRIGRVAVVKEARGKGVGKRLVEAALAEGARRGVTRFRLSSQVQAQAFYASLGFHAVGEPYMEDGIPHILMERSTAD